VTDFEFLHADPSQAAWKSPLSGLLDDRSGELRDVSAEASDGPLGLAAGLAGIEIDTPQARLLLARLTDLEPPGVGPVARVRTLVSEEDAGRRYRLWFPQEYAAYMAHVVRDALEGIR
jgi:hypothetical protein